MQDGVAVVVAHVVDEQDPLGGRRGAGGRWRRRWPAGRVRPVPRSTSASSGSCALQQPERVDQSGKVLAGLLGAEGQHVGTAIEPGQVDRAHREAGRPASPAGRRPPAPRPSSSRTWLAVCWDGTWTVTPLRTARRRTAPKRRTAPVTSCGRWRNQQSWTDTTVGRRDWAARCSSGRGRPRPRPGPGRRGDGRSRPQARSASRGRVAQPADPRAQLGPERQDVGQHVGRVVERRPGRRAAAPRTGPPRSGGRGATRRRWRRGERSRPCATSRAQGVSSG